MTATIPESSLSPLRAVSYVRVSTLDQALRGAEPEGLSIPAQREANRRRVLEMGALVVAEFVEHGRSGRSIGRPELQRMLTYIQAGPLTVNVVHRLLSRPYYKGVVVHNGVEHPGRHEPLIDPVTWATVQDVLTSRRNGERSREHDHYLKGTVFCIVQHTRTKAGRVYEYFVCHRRRDTVCQQRKALPIAQVEERVKDLYRTIELKPDQRDRVEQIVLATPHRQQAVNNERLEEIAEKAKTAEANQTKLLDAYYADAIPRDLFLTSQRRLKTELVELAREKAKLESDSADIEQRIRDALDLLQDAHTAYTNASTTVRKQLNRAIFTGIFLGPDQIRAELNEPFASITDQGRPGDD